MNDANSREISEKAWTPEQAVARRSVLAFLIAGASWICGLIAIPLARFALLPQRQQGSQAEWSDMGAVGTFAQLKAPLARPISFERRDGWQITAIQQTVYLVPTQGAQPRVLSAACPHLGCTVQWNPQREQFDCPCHGGRYASDGTRLAGPPNRNMDELPSRIQDGHLYVQFHSFRQLLATKETLD